MVDFHALMQKHRAEKAAREAAEDRHDEAQARAEAYGEPPPSTIAPAPVRTGPDPHAAWKKEPYSDISGTAGVGKTFFAKQWATEEKGLLLTASTGIAAINLGGATINGTLGFFNTESLRDLYISGFLERKLRKLYQAGLRRILLDEKSMVDAEQLTILTKVLEDLAGRGYSYESEIDTDAGEGPTDDAQQPVSLTLIGDWAQLPPVRAPFAFESDEWHRYDPHSLKLTTIHRQTDQAFIQALHAVRRADGEAALEYFGPRLQATMDQHFDGPTILAKNEAVYRFNDLRLSSLKTPQVRYRSERWTRDTTKTPGEWKNIPEELVLKEGALVMILANAKDPENPGGFLYVNGDLGDLVARESDDVALVRLRRTGAVVKVPKVTREVRIPLEVGRAKQLRKEGHADRIDGRWEIVAGMTYLPLRLAWATTCHKAQGLSLDQVQVNVNDGFFSTAGMTFVALSRARTAEGLRVVGHPGVFKARCTVDPKVAKWL